MTRKTKHVGILNFKKLLGRIGRKKIIVLLTCLFLIIIAVAVSTFLVIRHSHNNANKAVSTTGVFTYSDDYTYPFPATTKLVYGQKYIVNGIQYELDSDLPEYGLGGPCSSSAPKTQICEEVGVPGFRYGCQEGMTCVLDSFARQLVMKLTNVSGQIINYTSCFEQGANCTNDELTNQINVVKSVDFGCIAQRTDYKNYQTIADDQNVYNYGGFQGDPAYPQFDQTTLPEQLTLAAAITTFTNNGTGSTSFHPVTFKFNVGETKNALFEVGGQCVAVGAPDKSVFWPIH